MKLRGIDWGNVFNASGARGFFGEGYWFHKVWKPLGLNYDGATFVAKTTTLEPRKGNMLLDEKHRPAKLVPDCIVVKPWKGVVLNSVGLSGPGAYNLISDWAKLPGRFFVSFMSVESSPERRLREAKEFCDHLQLLVSVKGVDQLGLQVNFSCPNVGLDVKKQLTEEMAKTLTLVEPLGIPTLIKINALLPVDALRGVANHRACDGIVVSNTIPWGQLPDRIDWKDLFGSDTSPIAQYGGGGLSGKPLLPLVCEWIQRARTAGISVPIVGGGGILSQEDAGQMLDAGADAIELGSVGILRPWRVRGIINYVNMRMGN